MGLLTYLKITITKICLELFCGIVEGFFQLFSTFETWTNETFGELSFSMKNLRACAVWGKG
jgi:hypothetical protein